jgi:hypothetical protein
MRVHGGEGAGWAAAVPAMASAERMMRIFML